MELTRPQRSLIREISKHAEVVFCGIDKAGLPVIQFTDARRTTEEFAIPRTTHRKGAVRPQYPLAWYDIDTIDPGIHQFLHERCICS